MFTRGWILALVVALGCGSTVTQSAAPLDASTSDDHASAVDALRPPAECRAAIECADRGTPPALALCAGHAGWSCIVGRCTSECAPAGRTCEQASSGCVTCSDGAAACPGDACRIAPAAWSPRAEDSLCQRAFLHDLSMCFGEFALLSDGMVCSMRDAGTDAVRSVLACGPCQTSVLWSR